MSAKKVTITRIETSDEGTYGKLTTLGFECWTAELPWRDLDDNGKRDAGLSCIAPGVFPARWSQSAHRKNADGSPEWSFLLLDVPDAEGIRIHAGNFVGDRTKGYAADAEGCILLGRAIVESMEIPEHKRKAHPDISRMKQKGVASSRDTVAAFVEHMGKDPFELTILPIPARG